MARSARGGPVDVVVDEHRPVHRPGQHLGRIQVPDQERGVRQVHQASGGAVDRIGRADHGRAQPAGHPGPDARDRFGQGLRGRVRPRGAPQADFGAGGGGTEGVDRLRDDAVGADARHQRRPGVRGQRVVGADPAAAGGALARVGEQAGLAQPPHAVGDRRFGDPGPGGDLRAGQAPFLHQRAQHVLVGQRAQHFE
ncbi:hypothetical protein SHIRM173S_05996 [Streptomyces hirsutus]